MSAALMTDADARAMRKTKYPPEYARKVDMSKINLPVIQKWVSNEIARILNNEDDVVTEMIFSYLQSKSPNIKQLQNDLTGFLDKDAPSFCLELWKLCLSAQDDPNGIPKELLEAKKFELIQERIAEDKAREEAMKRQADERERDRELARIRDRERGQRGRGGRGGRGRDRDRSFDRRPSSRDSRSPPRRRDGRRGDGPRGDIDSYMPGGRGRGNGRPRSPPRRRRRSPSYSRSPSRSRSPPRRRRRYDSSVSRSPRRGKANDSEDDQKKSRSKSPKRRRSPSSSDDRTPPRRRHRSPSRSRSPRRHRYDSSRSPPPKRRSRPDSDDLISRTDRPRDDRRLSRGASSYSGSMDGANDEARGENEVGNDS